MKNGCGRREKLFDGENTLEEFGNFVISECFRSYQFLAANASRYDGVLMLKYLIQNRIVPKIIFNGGKIMQMKLYRHCITLSDTIFHMPMALAKLPEAFG